MANLPSDYSTISRSLSKRSRRQLAQAESVGPATVVDAGGAGDVRPLSPEIPMEGSHPALPAQPGTLKASLPDTPCIGQMTEKESAHPTFPQMGTLNINSNNHITEVKVNSIENSNLKETEPAIVETNLINAESVS